jgi:hypothetical protein
MTDLPGFADELEALSHRALKLPASSRNPEALFIARQELAHAMRRLAGKLRAAGRPADAEKPKPIRGPIVPGVVTDRRGNLVAIDFRNRRRP